MRIIKNGAPMIAVKMEIGISLAHRLRAKVSTMTMKPAPKEAQAGTKDK